MRKSGRERCELCRSLRCSEKCGRETRRTSKFPTTLALPITRKENYATRLAALVLPSASANKKRHETLQRFMLANDSATVAVEIPVYITKKDIDCYRDKLKKLSSPED